MTKQRHIAYEFDGRKVSDFLFSAAGLAPKRIIGKKDPREETSIYVNKLELEGCRVESATRDYFYVQGLRGLYSPGSSSSGYNESTDYFYSRDFGSEPEHKLKPHNVEMLRGIAKGLEGPKTLMPERASYSQGRSNLHRFNAYPCTIYYSVRDIDVTLSACKKGKENLDFLRLSRQGDLFVASLLLNQMKYPETNREIRENVEHLALHCSPDLREATIDEVLSSLFKG